MTPPNLITVGGNLREGYMQLQPNTMLHVDELTNERRTNPIDVDGTDLRTVSFYTPDGQLYSVRQGTPMLSMTRGDVNPVLTRVDDAFTELTTTNGNFQLTPEEAERALKSYSTIHVVLEQLRLKGDNAEWQYLVVPTKKEPGLRYEEEKLARRVFGDDTFDLNMEMFREARINESRIYVLNRNYVRQHAGERSLGRASWLSSFSGDSSFYAYDRNIYSSSRVRGVRRELIREADAIENVVPSAPEEIKTPTEEDIFEASRSYVSEYCQSSWAADLKKLFTP